MSVTDFNFFDKETLVEIILAEKKVIDDQNKVIGDLRAEVTTLQTRVTSLERASKRQAAPFRIEDNKRKKDKKNPSNKPGHKGHYRKFSGTIDKPRRVDPQGP